MSKKPTLKYIYGPVYSWRLGRSLGIDLLSQKKKVCSFNCLYCQLGKQGTFTQKRKIFVPTAKIIAELKKLPKMKVDFVTFSGRGEPTLAKNLGEAIQAVKRMLRLPTAVLSNATLLNQKNVRQELAQADFVSLKLDADCAGFLKKVNRPVKGINFSQILSGIKKFRRQYHDKLAIQIMFIPENQAQAEALARLVKSVHPDHVEINTPLRFSQAKPLSPSQIAKIKKYFSGIKLRCVYDAKRKKLKPLSKKSTEARRGTRH